MDTFQPLVNLLLVLTALSIAAERVTNLAKLRNDDLRYRRNNYADQRNREYALTGRTLVVGIILAVLVKANFFEILGHLDNPWSTIGWVQVVDHSWMRAPATQGWGTFLYALGGSVVTGVALGFGGKFWHDVLGIVFEIRNTARRRSGTAPPTKPTP